MISIKIYLSSGQIIEFVTEESNKEEWTARFQAILDSESPCGIVKIPTECGSHLTIIRSSAIQAAMIEKEL